MSNVLFFLIITMVAVTGGFVAMMIDAPTTQLCCLTLAVIALITALWIEEKSW